MENKYSATLEIINSRADIYGNRYWAFIYTDNATGRSVRLATGSAVSDSNIGLIPYYIHGGSHEPHDHYIVRQELPIRQFNRTVKGWAQCSKNGDDLAKYIIEQLKAA